MKKALAALIASSFALGAYAADSTQQRNDAYYMALMSMNHDLALYTLMMDKQLEAKCGRTQSLDKLKSSTDTMIYVLIALKDGRVSDAKALIDSVPCEPVK